MSISEKWRLKDGALVVHLGKANRSSSATTARKPSSEPASNTRKRKESIFYFRSDEIPLQTCNGTIMIKRPNCTACLTECEKHKTYTCKVCRLLTAWNNGGTDRWRRVRRMLV